MGMHQVGVGVTPAEVLPGNTVDHGAGFRAQHFLQDVFRIRTGDRVHGVEAHAEESGVEQLANAPEIEQRFHQGGVVRHGVDDLHTGIAE